MVFSELLVREPLAPRWRELLRVYRRGEARGEIRGGRVVGRFVGEQFALPEAVEALRRVRKADRLGEMTVVSACDPLNLVGVLTAGPRATATLGNRYTSMIPIPCSMLILVPNGSDSFWSHPRISSAMSR